MDIVDPPTYPRPVEASQQDGLMDVDAAIEMVRLGAARRMRLVALTDPDGLAAIALARSQAAGVVFRLERDRGSVTLTFERSGTAETPEPGPTPRLGG